MTNDLFGRISDCSEYKHLQHEKNVFKQPRAEAKRVWTMPRQGKGRMKSNVFKQPRAEAKRVWTMPRQGKGRMKSNE